MVDADRPPAILKIQSGQHRGESFAIPAEGAAIGNRDQAEVPLRDPWVSFEHARIVRQGDAWVFEDLDSSNGSFVDKQRVRERTRLEDGSIVHIGRTRCIFKTRAEAPAPLAPVVLPPPPPDSLMGAATTVSGLRIQLEKSLPDGLWVVQLEGDIDVDAADALREWIKGALDQGLRSVVLSLEQVPYINSTGLGVLIKVHDMLKNQGGGLVLTHVREKVQGPIRMLGLHRVFALEPDVRSAVSRFPKVGALTRQLKRTEMMIAVDPSLALADAPPLRAELVAESGSRAGRRWLLGAGESMLGSRLDVKVLLPDPHISWYHARVYVEEGEFWIEDLQSHAGTFLDGKRISKAPLQEGTLVRLGDTELRFHRLGEADAEGRDVPSWRLGQFEQGPVRGLVYLRELGDRLELGVACLGFGKAEAFRVAAWLLMRDQAAPVLSPRTGDPRFELSSCERPLLQRFEAVEQADLTGVVGVCVEVAGELYSFSLGRPAAREPLQLCPACRQPACLRTR